MSIGAHPLEHPQHPPHTNPEGDRCRRRLLRRHYRPADARTGDGAPSAHDRCEKESHDRVTPPSTRRTQVHAAAGGGAPRRRQPAPCSPRPSLHRESLASQRLWRGGGATLPEEQRPSKARHTTVSPSRRACCANPILLLPPCPVPHGQAFGTARNLPLPFAHSPVKSGGAHSEVPVSPKRTQYIPSCPKVRS